MVQCKVPSGGLRKKKRITTVILCGTYVCIIGGERYVMVNAGSQTRSSIGRIRTRYQLVW